MTPPVITIAFTRAELAEFRRTELTGMVAVLLNRFRGHGDPEEVCKAYEHRLPKRSARGGISISHAPKTCRRQAVAKRRECRRNDRAGPGISPAFMGAR